MTLRESSLDGLSQNNCGTYHHFLAYLAMCKRQTSRRRRSERRISSSSSRTSDFCTKRLRRWSNQASPNFDIDVLGRPPQDLDCGSTRLRRLGCQPGRRTRLAYIRGEPSKNERFAACTAQVLPGPPSNANLLTMLGPISSYSALVWQ